MEDITKRTDKATHALVDHKYQMAHPALIGDGSDVVVEFEVQHRLIHTIPDGNIGLLKELLKVGHDKGLSHLLVICHTYYDVESGAAAMCAGKTINAVQKSYQPKKQPPKQPSQC